jgi:aminopeptidase
MGKIDTIKAITKIFNINLGAKKGETALIFTDLIPPDADIDPVERSRRNGLVGLARGAAEAAESLGLKVRYLEFPALKSHGSEPEPALWRMAFGDTATSALEEEGLLDAMRDKRAGPDDIRRARAIVRAGMDDAADVVVALSNNSTSHTRFRDLLTSEAGARYASMPLFEEDMLWGSMDVDWGLVESRAAALAAGLMDGESVRVTTADGTDIAFSIKGRPPQMDTGNLTAPGSFSNLPAGEVYMAPLEGTANGVLVLNWAPNRRLESPVRVIVKDGFAEKVAGDEPYVLKLRAGLDARRDNRNIAELGIGVNDRATRPDNILESEKILGTVHIAFGDNSSMGGNVSTPFHQDFVFFRPTLTVYRGGKGRVLLEDGKLLTG